MMASRRKTMTDRASCEKQLVDGSSASGIRTRLSTGIIQMNGTSTVHMETPPDASPSINKSSTQDKKRNSAVLQEGHVADSSGVLPKKRRIGKNDGSGEDNKNDYFCWMCHKDGMMLCCELCPRVYHAKCVKTDIATTNEWVCPECERIMKAECMETRSQALSMITMDTLSTLFKFALIRMHHQGATPFEGAVNIELVPNYYDYVFYPMDLSILEKNIKKKVYGSTEAFQADAKWILHNCNVYNGSHHKLTASAKMIVKICKHEMDEIEVCPDCYLTSCLKKGQNWFAEPCRIPHTLVWAKLKGYPFWPAKALQDTNNQTDVRFFGTHDRAWVPVSQIYLLSKDIPTPLQKKRAGFDEAMTELQIHINKIKARFGSFEYAAYRTPYDKNNVYYKNRLKNGAKQKKNKLSTLKKSPISLAGHTLSKKVFRSNKMADGKLGERQSAVAKTALALKNKYSTVIKGKKAVIKTTAAGVFLVTDNADSDTAGSSSPSPIVLESPSKGAEGNKINKIMEETKNMDEEILIKEETHNEVLTRVDPLKADTDKQPGECVSIMMESSETIKSCQKNDKNEANDDGITKDSSEEEDILHKCDLISTDISLENKEDYNEKLKKTIESCKARVPDSSSESDYSSTSSSDSSNSDDNDNTEEDQAFSGNDGANKNDNTESDLSQSADVAAKINDDSTVSSTDAKNGLSVSSKLNCVLPQTGESASELKDTISSNTSADGSKTKSPESSIDANPNSEAVVQSKNGIESNDNLSCKLQIVNVETLSSVIIATNGDKSSVHDEIEAKNSQSSKEVCSETMSSDKSSANRVQPLTSSDKSLNVTKPLVTSSEKSVTTTKPTVTFSEKSVTGKQPTVTCSEAETTASTSSPTGCKPSPANTGDDSLNKDNVMISSGSSNSVDSSNSLSGQTVFDMSVDSPSRKSKQPDVKCAKIHAPTKTSPKSVLNKLLRKKCFPGFSEMAVTAAPDENEHRHDLPKPVKTKTKLKSNIPAQSDCITQLSNQTHQHNLAKQTTVSSHTQSKMLDNTAGIQTSYGPGSVVGDDLFMEVETQHDNDDRLSIDLGQTESESEKSDSQSQGPRIVKAWTFKAVSNNSSNPTQAGINKKTVRRKNENQPVNNPAEKLNQQSYRSICDKYSGKILSTLQETMAAMSEEIETLRKTQQKDQKPQETNWAEESKKQRQEHAQEMEEVRHNYQLTILEMQACWEAEKERILTQAKKDFEKELDKAVRETKKKQWCAHCGKEAVFYCCWNTSYCDYPCQQSHWAEHMHSCMQVQNSTSSEATTEVQQQQPKRTDSGDDNKKGASWVDMMRDSMNNVLQQQEREREKISQPSPNTPNPLMMNGAPGQMCGNNQSVPLQYIQQMNTMNRPPLAFQHPPQMRMQNVSVSANHQNLPHNYNQANRTVPASGGNVLYPILQPQQTIRSMINNQQQFILAPPNAALRHQGNFIPGAAVQLQTKPF